MNKNEKPVGALADLKSKVEIGKFMGGYFANPKNCEAFWDIGIKPILGNLSDKLKYVDFGGGEGVLAEFIDKFLKKSGKSVFTTVADINENYLKKAGEKGIDTELCNIESCKLKNLDLVTARAVLHYNTEDRQPLIIKKIYDSLKDGGYFVHQVSSGSAVNVRLRSAIINLPSLGRVGKEQYYRWTTIDETIALHNAAGFSSSMVAGYAPPSKWGTMDQWERMHAAETREAEDKNDFELLAKIKKQKEKYLVEANSLIEQYLIAFGPEQTGIEKLADESYTIHYTYPVILSRK